MQDESSANVKKALKGVHVRTNLSREDFLHVLYHNSVVMRKQVRLRRDPQRYTVRLQEEQKKALNAIYYKMKISDNFISCSPHTDADSNYL